MYAFFLKTYGRKKGENFVLDDKFNGDSEYRFISPEKIKVVRFFRDKECRIKLLAY